MADQAVINGRNVNRVEYGDGHERKGTLQQIARNRWSEDSVISGEVHFEYIELRRDEWSVYLHDADRDMYLQLDLHTRELKYGIGAAPSLPMYVVIEASQRPHGRIVNRVEMGQGGTRNGTLRQVASRRWQEIDVEGAVTSEFDEANRDDWSVNLHDPGRDVRLRIDLHTRTIYYAAGGSPESPLYEILGAAAEVNGWLVNLVEVGSTESGPTGRFAQVTVNEWAETDLTGTERRRLNETARDDWSVYLHDPDADDRVQLDLFTRRVNLTAGGQPARHESDVLTVTDINVPPAKLPEHRPVRGLTVNRVEMARAGESVGVLRQVDNVTWVEDSVSEGRDRHRFDERTRDEWSVYLHDPERNLSLQIDLHTKIVSYGHGTTVGQPLADVSAASDEPTGWLVSEVAVAGGDGPSAYRQVDWTTWVATDDDARELAVYSERQRDDWSVYLRRSDGEEIQLDLFTREVKRTGASSTVAGSILDAVAAEGAWTLGETITSRSQLTTIYRPSAAVGGQRSVLEPIGTAYREAITFSHATRWVDIRATEETEVTIRGHAHPIDAVKAVRVTPNDAAKIVVTVPVAGLRCASLSLVTNLMKPGTRHLVMPDADCHKKIAGLEDGELKRNRQALGTDATVSGEALDQAQRTVQDLLAGVQYAYNVTPTGVQHDRAIRPANMAQPNFALSVAGDQLVRSDLSPQDGASAVAGAVQSTGAAQSFWNELENVAAAGLDAISVTVTTGLAIGDEIVEGGIDLLDQGGQMIDRAGERLVNGDPEGAMRELMQGGENIGRGLNERGRKILEHGEHGVREIAVIVIETLEGKPRSLEASVNNFLAVAQDVIERVGVAWDAFVDWLADAIGWGGVLDTQRAIQDMMTRSFADARAVIPEMRVHLDQAMGAVREGLGAGTVRPEPTPQRSVDPVGAAMAELDSILDDVLAGLPGNDLLDGLPAAPGVGDAVSRLSQIAVGGGSELLRVVEQTVPTLAERLTQAVADPERLVDVLIDTMRNVALVGVELVESAAEVLIDVLDELLELCETLFSLELYVPVVSELYGAITEGESMTLGGLVALVIAIPVTITHRALLGGDPEFHRAAALAQQDGKGWGITYSVAHMVLSITDGLAIATRNNKVVGVIGLAAGVVAQAMGCPKPNDPGAGQGNPGDPLQRPQFMADFVWGYQWLFVGMDVLELVGDDSGGSWGGGSTTARRRRRSVQPNRSRSRKGARVELEALHSDPNPLPLVVGVLGIAHLYLMFALLDADVRKISFLDLAIGGLPSDVDTLEQAQALGTTVRETSNPFPGGAEVVVPTNDTELQNWAASMRNYHAWAHTDGMLALKTIGNALDSVPSILQFLTMFASPTSRAVAIGVGGVAHIAEGTIYIVRTVDNQLL